MPWWLIFALGLITGGGLYLLYDKYFGKAEAYTVNEWHQLEARVSKLEADVTAKLKATWGQKL